MMNEAIFEDLYNRTILEVEDQIETSGEDIDFETVNDILTLTCSDDSAIIITRQIALYQLWLAAKSGGFHFDFDAATQKWLCTSDQLTLDEKLTTICQQQGSANIEFAFANT